MPCPGPCRQALTFLAAAALLLVAAPKLLAQGVARLALPLCALRFALRLPRAPRRVPARRAALHPAAKALPILPLKLVLILCALALRPWAIALLSGAGH